MKDTVYLVVSPRGIDRMRKRDFDLRFNEVAVRVTIEIPDAVFRKPIMDCYLKVGPEDVKVPEIAAEMLTSAQELLEEHWGAKIVLQPAVEYTLAEEESEDEG